MRKQTHLACGALAALPIADGRTMAATTGVILLASMGAVIPDYLDLRSDARRLMTHRGFSHSIAAGAIVLAWVWLVLSALAELADPDWRLAPDLVRPLTLAFLAGHVSHLLLDACTPGGIRPGLPLLGNRVWLLPRRLRIPTGGRIDHLIGSLGAVTLLAVATASVIDRWYVR